jgi:hypothetical protein
LKEEDSEIAQYQIEISEKEIKAKICGTLMTSKISKRKGFIRKVCKMVIRCAP